MNILLNTLQNEIAECLEKSYKKISLISAMKMLHINTLCEMNKFAAKVILGHVVQGESWKLNSVSLERLCVKTKVYTYQWRNQKLNLIDRPPTVEEIILDNFKIDLEILYLRKQPKYVWYNFFVFKLSFVSFDFIWIIFFFKIG